MRVRYTSTVFLFYSTNLAKIKAYRELPTSAKSLQKVLFLNTPYVILNTKNSQSSFSGKIDFYPQHPKLPKLQAWKSRQAPVCTANVNSFTQIKLQLPEYWDGIRPSEVIAVPAHEIFKKRKSPIKRVLLGSHN